MVKVVKLNNGSILGAVSGEYKIVGRNVFDFDDEGNERLRFGGISEEFEVVEDPDYVEIKE